MNIAGWITLAERYLFLHELPVKRLEQHEGLRTLPLSAVATGTLSRPESDSPSERVRSILGTETDGRDGILRAKSSPSHNERQSDKV